MSFDPAKTDQTSPLEPKVRYWHQSRQQTVDEMRAWQNVHTALRETGIFHLYVVPLMLRTGFVNGQLTYSLRLNRLFDVWQPFHASGHHILFDRKHADKLYKSLIFKK